MGSSVYMIMFLIASVVSSDVRTCIYVYLFIRSFYVVNFNVSNTKLMHMLNFLDMFSVGVTITWERPMSLKTTSYMGKT
jgi:hypothetical protein